MIFSNVLSLIFFFPQDELCVEREKQLILSGGCGKQNKKKFIDDLFNVAEEIDINLMHNKYIYGTLKNTL